MHIAQGVFKAMNVNKCTAEGTNSTFVFWVADWFALMNDKMGGDLEKIKTVGEYLIEVWTAAGMNLDNVVFKWASEEITNNADKYWPTMLDVARRFNITRVKKCCQIMGRLEGSLTAAQILYPLMQCTDVFFLKANICQLGVDQRKVNMLAREYCDAAKIKNKPIILSHHMLFGLKAGQEKMSKSDPDSAVFMEDSAEDVERKIMNAYCPTEEENEAGKEKEEAQDAGKESMHLVEDKIKNPCLDYIQHIIFSPPGATFEAGDKTYTDFAEVRNKFLTGEISEKVLKQGLISALNALLEPVRNHFTNDERAKNLLALVQQYKKEKLPKDSKARRLNLVELGKVSTGSHLVFAPLPNAAPRLQEAMDVVNLLKMSNDRPSILFLSDWSARVCNTCDADIKAITAYYTVLLTTLKALDPKLMEKVQVLWQSEAILADPSNYWISVINVGRHFSLNDVMGPDMKDSEGAGIVISRLMKVADVAGVEPATLSFVKGDKSASVEASMVDTFFTQKLPGLSAPVVSIEAGPSLLLQQRESEAHKTENDEYYLLDDPKVSLKLGSFRKLLTPN
jgi:tyrosyl-tRNA synthetase